MVDVETTAGATPEAAISQAVQMITFNNRTYTPEQLQTAVKETESNLLSDYNKKMAAVKDERGKMTEALRKDVEFYNANPQVLRMRNPMSVYEPLIDGGRGLVGTIPQEDGEEARTSTTPAFEDSPKIRALEKEVVSLKGTVEAVNKSVEETQINRVSQKVADLVTKKYPNSIHEQVLIEMTNFFYTNGRHPSDAEIENIVKSNHELVGRFIAHKTKAKEETGAPTTSKTTTPSAKGGGLPGVPSQGKAVSLDDPDFATKIAERFEARRR